MTPGDGQPVARDPATAPNRPAPGWRPPARSSAHSTAMVVTLVVALAVTTVAMFGLARLARRGRARLGPQLLTLRDSAAFARRIDRDGPVLFPDPGSRTLDVWVSRPGGRHEWAVFAASTNGDRRCNLVYRAASRDFTDPCTGATIGLDGAGHRQFPWSETDKDALQIDLRIGAATTAP